MDWSSLKRYLFESGVTKIQIIVRVKPTFSVTQAQAIPNLKEANSTFNDVLSTASNSSTMFSGKIIYDEKATIELNFKYGEVNENGDIVGGISGSGSANVTLGGKDKTGRVVIQRSIKQVAESVTHELLHEGGVNHPDDFTEPDVEEDVRLKPVMYFELYEGKLEVRYKFNTTTKTVGQIHNNVMNSNHITIDDKKVSDFRNSDGSGANRVSKGQLDTVIKNIDKGKVNGDAMKNQ